MTTISRQLYSTMGAPVSEMDTARILHAWAALADHALPVQPDPVEMLAHATSLVMLISDLRSAINNGWHAANKRKWPTPPRPPHKSKSIDNLTLLRKLGMTDEEILAAVTNLRSSGGLP